MPLKVDRAYIECDRTIIDDFSSQSEFDTYVGVMQPRNSHGSHGHSFEFPIEDMSMIRTSECP